MTSLPVAGANARAVAIAELFTALEGLLITYHALPDAERTEAWSADADRITGEVARHLSGARGRLSTTFVRTAVTRPAVASTRSDA